MADFPDLTSLIDQTLNSLLTKLKPILYILLALIIVYILYKLIRSFFTWRDRVRAKKTYENTEKILEILDRIEKKIEQLGKKPEEKAKPEKTKKKKL